VFVTALDWPSLKGMTAPNDLLIGGVLRTNEMQVWFLSEHLTEWPASDSAD
jgi:hypothetical protein